MWSTARPQRQRHRNALMENCNRKLSSQIRNTRKGDKTCVWKSLLTGQVEDLEHKLQLLSSEIMGKDQRYQDLHAEYESLRDLLKSRDSSAVTVEPHQRSRLAFWTAVCTEQFLCKYNWRARKRVFRKWMPCSNRPKSESSSMLQNRVVSLEFFP